MFKQVTHTLTSAVAPSGTFTVDYPANTNAGTFRGAVGHTMSSEANDTYTSPTHFSLTFGTANITVTMAATGVPTLAADTKFWIDLQIMGEDDGETSDVRSIDGVHAAPLHLIDLGAPDAADADGVCASQAINTTGTIAGALASGGVATFDVPRNVVASWTNTAVLTVTGTDNDGNVMVESSGSGTSMAGKKAFKTITAVTSSVSITGATVGTGDVLGLPVFLPQVGMVMTELEDGADATAGTLVAGADAVATATTGDVRGTYDANSAANGAKAFQLLVALPDPSYKGVAQYAG